MNAGSPLWVPSQPLLGDAYGLADASRFDPLADAEADFDRAQVTIIYVRDADSNERTMLLGAVELLTPWTEAGPEVPRQRHDPASYLCPSGTRAEVNVRRVILPVGEALVWYRGCSTGSVMLPAIDDERRRMEPAKTLRTSMSSDEPPWPRLVAGRYDDASVELPLVGHRLGGTRTHHILSLSPPALPADWNAGARANVRAWLRNWIHWDLLGRPALLGSAHLIVSNPLFRELHVRLAGSSQEDVVFLRVDPLPGRSTATLVATVEDIRPYGPAFMCTVPLTSRSTEVRLTRQRLVRLCPPGRGQI